MVATKPESLPGIPLVQPWLPEGCADAVRDQVLSGWVGPGPAVTAFGEALARFVGCEHALLTVSGTVALTVAAHALGLAAGAEVLVPAYGVISTVNGLAMAGLSPRLVDIDRRTGCLAPAALEVALSTASAAVCFVDFSGRTGAELEQVAALCAARRLPFIEDAACALGHHHRGRSAGTFGTIGTFSFSVPKIVTTGQGGALVTADPALWQRAAAFIDQGDLAWRQTGLNREIGTNLRFTDLQAALGLSQLREIEARLRRRQAAFEVLAAGLRGLLWTLPDGQAPLHHVVFSRQPDLLVARLREQGIGAVRQYRTICRHPAYRHLDTGRPLPGAEFWTEHAVFLPFGVSLSEADAARIADAVTGSGVPLLAVEEETCS